MKKDGVHPQYYKDAKITCSCGNIMTMGSVKKELHTELCSKCHPFYTGQQKLVDTAGRVDKFRNKQETAKKAAEAATKKTPKKRRKTMEEKVNEKLQKETEKTAE